MIHRFSKLFCGLAVTALIAIGSNVHAAPLLPGGAIPVPPEADPVGGGAFAGTPITVPFATGGPGGYSGTLTSTVFIGNANPLGGLTFMYQLHNDATSLSALERMTNIDFTGYQTDVSFQFPGPAGVIPTTVDRDATGSTVGWNFSSLGLGAIAPGQDSVVMVIQTDAQAFAPVNASIIDGVGTTAQSFGPVPEPGTLALLAAGSLLALRRQRA